MHGFITGGAVERARNFRGATRPVLVPACPSHLIQHEMLHTSGMALLDSIYSFAVLEYPCSRHCTKEVIRLQVPLQPPCYDFSPLAELRFDHHNMR